MIFDRKPTEYGQPSVIVPLPKAGSPSHGLPPCAIIDASLNIEGDLATDGDVQVDGHINGNVNCARLTIGKDGAITGDIKANEIVVRGKVKGAIRATRVILIESADVAGDIFYDRMSMEEGAHFVGASYAGPLPFTASPPDEKISKHCIENEAASVVMRGTTEATRQPIMETENEARVRNAHKVSRKRGEGTHEHD